MLTASPWCSNIRNFSIFLLKSCGWHGGMKQICTMVFLKPGISMPTCLLHFIISGGYYIFLSLGFSMYKYVHTIADKLGRSNEIFKERLRKYYRRLIIQQGTSASHPLPEHRKDGNSHFMGFIFHICNWIQSPALFWRASKLDNSWSLKVIQRGGSWKSARGYQVLRFMLLE